MTATGKEARAAAAANKEKRISLEHHVDIDITLERSRHDIIIANGNIYYHSYARSRPLEGLADSSLRTIESEGAAEITGFVGYPQILLCLRSLGSRHRAVLQRLIH